MEAKRIINLTGEGAGLIFDIQRFSIHDGPGIRTTVFFKGCPLDCVWCQNPESKKYRREIAFYAESCRECFSCARACPEGAILESPGKRIDFTRCNACGKCVSVCTHDGLRMVGKSLDPAGLVREIEKDRDFFDDSGGGITLSGGEPLVQTDFLLRLLPMIKNAGLHLNVETSGMYNPKRVAKLLPYMDSIYFDIKHMDDAMHKRYTGCGNRTILENFSELSKRFSPMQARMPVVPGVNDGRKNIEAVSEFLNMHGRGAIHCLPYHPLGESKIGRIDSNQEPMNVRAPSARDLETVREIFQKKGIDAVVYD